MHAHEYHIGRVVNGVDHLRRISACLYGQRITRGIRGKADFQIVRTLCNGQRYG